MQIQQVSECCKIMRHTNCIQSVVLYVVQFVLNGLDSTLFTVYVSCIYLCMSYLILCFCFLSCLLIILPGIFIFIIFDQISLLTYRSQQYRYLLRRKQGQYRGNQSIITVCVLDSCDPGPLMPKCHPLRQRAPLGGNQIKYSPPPFVIPPLLCFQWCCCCI